MKTVVVGVGQELNLCVHHNICTYCIKHTRPYSQTEIEAKRAGFQEKSRLTILYVQLHSALLLVD